MSWVTGGLTASPVKDSNLRPPELSTQSPRMELILESSHVFPSGGKAAWVSLFPTNAVQENPHALMSGGEVDNIVLLTA